MILILPDRHYYREQGPPKVKAPVTETSRSNLGGLSFGNLLNEVLDRVMGSPTTPPYTTHPGVA